MDVLNNPRIMLIQHLLLKFYIAMQGFLWNTLKS